MPALCDSGDIFILLTTLQTWPISWSESEILVFFPLLTQSSLALMIPRVPSVCHCHIYSIWNDICEIKLMLKFWPSYVFLGRHAEQRKAGLLFLFKQVTISLCPGYSFTKSLVQSFTSKVLFRSHSPLPHDWSPVDLRLLEGFSCSEDDSSNCQKPDIY